MYATINIGNPRMTRELLEGNSRTLVYAGCNANSCIHYASCNDYSRVHNSTLRKNIYQAGLRVNASQFMLVYSALANFNPNLSFCVPT